MHQLPTKAVGWEFPSGVTLPVGPPLPEKSPPVGSPSPFGAPSLNLNQLDDLQDIPVKSLKKCVSRVN